MDKGCCCGEDCCCDARMTKRIMLTIIFAVAWLSFVILYVAFWASGLSLFQSIAVILVSILILGGILGAMWVSWGMKMTEGMGEKTQDKKKTKKE